LAAIVPIYYGSPTDVLALTDQAVAVGGRRSGVHLALAHTYRALALAQISAVEECLTSLTAARDQVQELSDTDRIDSVFGFSPGRWQFYHGRILSYLGKLDEAWAIHDEALRNYPSSAVGDTTLIYFDRAISVIRAGDVERGIDLAANAYDDLPVEHRTDLFIRAGHRVLATVERPHRDTPSVRTFRHLLRTGTTTVR
jgi:hypothetical protein